MRKILWFAFAGLFFVTPAKADFTAKDASAATITFKNANTCTASVCIPQTAITDSTGTSFVVVTTAGADAQSNTANGLLTYTRNLVFNGTTWDRWTGAITAASLPLPTGAATSANQPTNAAQASTTSGQTGTLVQCAVTTAAPTYTTATTNPINCDTAGNQRVTVTNANPNGRAVSGSSAPVVMTPALTTFHLIAAATTNATSVKGSAATLYSCQLSGVGSTPAFLKIYNKATAPTVGTDTPVKTLIIPAASTAANGAGSNIIFGSGGGLTLGTGFALAVTGVITDADTTAVAASTFAINCDYE
jgi:hypothetical protein